MTTQPPITRFSASLIQMENLGTDAPNLWAHRCRVDDACPPHDHDFMEIAVVLAGQGRHLSPQGEQALGPGDVIVLRPGTWHSFHDCRQLDVFNCSFKMELLHSELASLKIYPAIHYLFWTGPLAMNRQGQVSLRFESAHLHACLPLLEQLAQASSQANGATSSIERVGYLMLFLAKLAHAIENDPQCHSLLAARIHPAVQEGVRLLESDVRHPWTLGTLSARLYINQCHLARLFTSCTGLSPMAYLARCRAERAASLLLRTRMPVSEVALEVGWPDANYFARRFKAHFNLTPSQYREQFGSAGFVS